MAVLKFDLFEDYFKEISDTLKVEPLGGGWPDQFGENLRIWMNRRKKINTLSLFSGGGGLDIGFHDAGFNIVKMIEIEEKFVQTLERNSGSRDSPLGNAQALCIDIKDFDTSGLGQIDFVIGGPPCQTFSAAGRRANGVRGINDPRGMLFQEYIRILDELRPHAFLFENVFGILGAQDGEPWSLIKKSFEEAGYFISFRILDSADFGVPQHRERLFIVGWREGSFLFPQPTHGPDSGFRNHYIAGDAIQGIKQRASIVPQTLDGKYGYLLEGIPPGLNYSYYTEKLGHPKPVFAWRSKFSDFLYKADSQVPVRTIKAQGGKYTGPFHWDDRPFSVDELKRLQTFPDDYEIAGSRATIIKQIGNSVTPQLARILALSVRDQIFKASVPAKIRYLHPNEKLTFRELKSKRSKEYKKIALKSINALILKDDASDTNSPKQAIRNRNRFEQDIWTCQAKITSDFQFLEEETGNLSVKVSAKKNWRVSVSDIDNGSVGKFKITIKPKSRNDWQLPVSNIYLDGSQTMQAFCSSWKAFEICLTTNTSMADLVQLNGYYQYPSKLKIEMNVEDTTNYWGTLSDVVAGNSVGDIMSSIELADRWDIEPENILEICLWLKSLGFEIRNSNTNQQIPKGHWLIPYSFPSLTSSSVQLNKQLI